MVTNTSINSSFSNDSKELSTALRWTFSNILGRMLLFPSSVSALDIWQLNIQRLDLKRRILEDWAQTKVDVVIAPGFGVPALPIGYPGWLPITSSYTCVYNMLDFPAGSMPVSPDLIERPDIYTHLLLNCR